MQELQASSTSSAKQNAATLGKTVVFCSNCCELTAGLSGEQSVVRREAETIRAKEWLVLKMDETLLALTINYCLHCEDGAIFASFEASLVRQLSSFDGM